MSRITFIIALFAGVIGFSSCEKSLGEKTDLDFIEIPDFQSRQVAYVPIQPILNQFDRPTDVVAGFDELIYVVDAGREEIVALDQSGKQLYTYNVPGVYAMAQDRSLDILALGTKDTVIAGTDYELSCLYRLELKSGLGFGLKNAKVEEEIVHPFYFKNSFLGTDAEVRFTSVAIVADNSYYITRTGKDNRSNKFGGPDNTIIYFSKEDKYEGNIQVSTNGGVFSDYFKQPGSITTGAAPPQISVSGSRNFVYTSLDPDADNQFRVRAIAFVESDFGASYFPMGRVAEDTAKAFGFLTEADKFSKPVDVTVSGDGTGFIFVLDAEKDSLFQFTSNGLEGIKPPPGAVSTKYIKASFGGKGKAATQFDNPQGVAYLNKILYVADTGNGRLLRFKLTTDFR